MTDSQKRAIEILRSGAKTGLEVAMEMWPDSPGWAKPVNNVHGRHAGGTRNNNAGMSRPAKAMLTRLMKMGLVRESARESGLKTQFHKYELTAEGRA